MTTQMSIRGVLFDLDGTLLDTAPDMALALNRLRQEQGRPAIAFDQIRPHVSHGALALIRIGFPDADQEQVESLRARFLELYRADLHFDVGPPARRAVPRVPAIVRLRSASTFQALPS